MDRRSRPSYGNPYAPPQPPPQAPQPPQTSQPTQPPQPPLPSRSAYAAAPRYSAAPPDSPQTPSGNPYVPHVPFRNLSLSHNSPGGSADPQTQRQFRHSMVQMHSAVAAPPAPPAAPAVPTTLGSSVPAYSFTTPSPADAAPQTSPGNPLANPLSPRSNFRALPTAYEFPESGLDAEDPLTPLAAPRNATAGRGHPRVPPRAPPRAPPRPPAGNTPFAPPPRRNTLGQLPSPVGLSSGISSGISPPPSASLNRIPAPTMTRLGPGQGLSPVRHHKPKHRRMLPEGGFISPLQALSVQLTSTYSLCNPRFAYNAAKNPRRVLTHPSTGKFNSGCDNENSDYILYVNDILGGQENRRYLVLDLLGHGTFGQVVKCQDLSTGELVAVKVIKAMTAYLNQSLMEVSILEHLNHKVDPRDEHHFLRLLDRFVHKEHLCLVFELLGANLFELIEQNEFKGLDIAVVQVIARQLFDSLRVLKDWKIIHCDLKPENILIRRFDTVEIKVIDFGSACHEQQTVYTYIQSRFYRSPEVILGLHYSCAIDMWSTGCILAELYLGLPLFPGWSEYNQLCRVVEALGDPPAWMVDLGKNSKQFYTGIPASEAGMSHSHSHSHNNSHTAAPRRSHRLKTREEYSREFGVEEKPSKQYFSSQDLREIVLSGTSGTEAQKLQLYDLIRQCLNLNPLERITPHQALSHPFLAG